MDDCTKTDKNYTENSCEIDKDNEQNGLENANSHSMGVVQRRQLSLRDANDIAKGQENVVIPLVNDVNKEYPPSFQYIPQNVVFQNGYVNFSLARIGENCCSNCFGNCLSSPTPCACANETGGEFVYTLEGLVKEDFLEECISMNRDPQKHCMFYCKECPQERSKNDDIPEPCKGHLVRKFIKECWWKCGCSKLCGNRVVQRGINRKLQVRICSKDLKFFLPVASAVIWFLIVLFNFELYEINFAQSIILGRVLFKCEACDVYIFWNLS